MPKWLCLQKILHVRLTTCLSITLCLVAINQFFASYGYYNYRHLDQESLRHYLYTKRNPNLTTKSKSECRYNDILQSSKFIYNTKIPRKYDDFVPNGIINGSYSPQDCIPLFSVAILVTYRNRQSQLDIFIPYIHNFLRKQNIHYKIYIIEQQDEKQWNKGLLYNIGAKQAILDKFPCLILHDIDLLPLDDSNLYACLNQPRHMSASIDKFRFVLIYKTLVGGVLAITSDQYKELNGFSNKFQGWGGEDDDFAGRISNHNLEILRFPPHMSRYTMLQHKQEHKNKDRHRIMEENKHNSQNDGLNSVRYEMINIKNHRLFTLIGVRL
ncbi:beta-1,4-N-acetylgalactosaminyltransferase bre-4-like [Melitaea cinxia]|uniref:beta-1,4-N-acetylgalactosaminyltransferase bre-4-like n=1 Tax=Melitaea cinxia TaxID=113334 RepID=UPI001E2731B6|nr:beta-1,4-N-acetylgalactosaminyltransferase bre-4-like [Melitaea cinxia]